MSDRYVIVGGKSPQQKPWSMPTIIQDGITALEKTIAGMRREQEGLHEQMTKQRAWLHDPANRDDPLYDQRQAIYQDRQSQWRDLEERSCNLLDQQQAQIDSLEGVDKANAIQRLLSWSEAPFMWITVFVLIGGAL